jgi:hypothetical protein
MNTVPLHIVAIVCVLASALHAGQLTAGAAKRSITPELKAGKPVYLAGFGNNRVATGVHDDLHVRCVAMSTGAQPVVICGVDSIGLFWDDVAKIRAKVPGATVVVCATHVHQAPDTMGLWGPNRATSGIDDSYNSMLVDRAAEAAGEAIRTMRPARATFAAVSPQDVAGYFHDSRPPVVLDPEILTLALNDRGGKRIATLVNWASHPEALGSKNTLITADWPAALYQGLEKLDGGTAVFINGAVGGMQSPLGAKILDPLTKEPAPASSFRFAEVVGEYVLGQVRGSVARAKSVDVTEIAFRETTISIPVANKGFVMAAQAGLFKGRKAMVAETTAASPVGYLRLSAGGKPLLEAALVPGELYPEVSVGGTVCDRAADFPDAAVERPIKKMLTAPYRMLFGLANDEIGYIIPKCEWDEKPPYTFDATKPHYGEVNSVGPEAAPMIVTAFAGLLP